MSKQSLLISEKGLKMSKPLFLMFFLAQIAKGAFFLLVFW